MIQVVIGTTPNREHWLSESLKAIGERPVMVLSDYTFELGKIEWVYRNTNIDRFLFMQDSVIIKDPEFFTLLESFAGSISINKDPSYYGCYLGVYERQALSKVDHFPKINKKSEAIYNEIHWNIKYVQAAKAVTLLFPELSDANAKKTEMKYGRENLVLENDYLIKYKGDWGQRDVD